MIKIKDLKWDKSKELNRAAAVGVSGHYIIGTVCSGEYESKFVDMDAEFKYTSEFLGYATKLDAAIAICDKHHKKRVTDKYLTEDE